MLFLPPRKHIVASLMACAIVVTGCSKPRDNSKDNDLATVQGETVIDEGNGQRLGLADNHLEFRYMEMGRDEEFKIDQNLNLSVPYRYAFSFQPVITDPSVRGMAPPRLTNGKLRITFVLFASKKGDPKDDTRYLTSNEVTADIGANGYVSGTVVLRYPHILFASGRQTVLIHLSTVDKKLGQSFSGSLSYIDQQAVLIMAPDSRDGQGIRESNQKQTEEQKNIKVASPLNRFIARTRPTVMRVSDFPFFENIGQAFFKFMSWRNYAISQEELSYALKRENLNNTGFPGLYSTVSVKERLCMAYMGQNPQYAGAVQAAGFTDGYTANVKKNAAYVGSVLCNEHNMNDHVKIQTFDFVERLNSEIPQNINIVAYTNQEFGIYSKKEHNRGNTIGFGAKFPSSLLLGMVDVSASHFETKSMLDQGNFGMTQIMAVDMGTMNVDADVRSCVLISSVGTTDEEIQQKPWLICDRDVQPSKIVSESFYYYSQIFAANHSPFNDPFNPQTGVKVFIRGKPHMRDMIQVFENADFKRTGFNVFVQAHVPDLNQLSINQHLETLTDQDIPGAVGRD